MNKYKKYFSKIGSLSLFSYASFSIKQQTFFAKRLSFLIKAGVPILESMHVIKKQAKSKNDIRIFNKIITNGANGQTLAASLDRFKGVFGNFAVNIIRAGESSGTLTANLNYLAEELKKKETLRQKIMSALLYPFIVTIATFGITGLLIVYVFPKIVPVFESINAKLPLSTRIVMWVSDVVRQNGLYILLGIALFSIVLYILVKKMPRIKLFYDGLILRLPLVGKIIKNYNLTNTTRTLGLLLRSGSTFTDALILTADTTENAQYKKSFSAISEGVMKGKNASEIMGTSTAIFPDMLVHMVSIGERSGNLSNTLLYLSEYYENEFDDQTKNLSSSIEPILMIVMGLLVGFVAISVITPIYEITTTLQR